jgi:hypothetical protein
MDKKNAKIGNVNDTNEETIQSDPSLELRRRYGTLCSRMVKIATLAAEHEKKHFNLLWRTRLHFLKELRKKLRLLQLVKPLQRLF